MSIKFHPDQGSILICDFGGLIEPEMTKKRPVIVVSPKFKDRTGLCTIVPLSTTPPRPVKPFHYKLQTNPPLPSPYDKEFHWVKGDMLYTVSFGRLSLLFDGKNDEGKRVYDTRCITNQELLSVQNCIRNSLGL
jgi:uncharacterized protein YifN (PemK superfamily)